MKFIDKKISNSYSQMYLILSANEKKEFVKKAKDNLIQRKKQEVDNEIELYRNIKKTSQSEKSQKMIDKFIKKRDSINIENCNFDNTEIEEEILELLFMDIFNHIDNLGIAQVFNPECNFIGNINDNNSITLVYSYVYIDLQNYELKFPTKKGNGYLFTSKEVQMILTEMMIANKLYKKEKVLKVSEFSDLLFSYMCEDDMQFNLYMDISEIENKFNIDRYEIIGLDRNKYLVKNGDGNNCVLNIKEIYDKKVYEINDEHVKTINFMGSKTVKELRKNIEQVFSFVYNINSNVTSVLENIADVNDFYIDEYSYKHFCECVGYDHDTIDDDAIKEMKMSFITTYIFSKYEINIDKYYMYLEQEYNLLYKIKKPEDDKTFEDYLNMKASYYALYELFRTKNLVTERSFNE